MIVTLLTDFGLADHYVASMKGVILSVDARIQIVDISHEVPPFDTNHAAFLLAASHSWFPRVTVHVVVVDPGVGSERRPLAIRAMGSYFVGPDNGVLSLAVAGARDLEVVAIDPRRIREEAPSSTFHGRDIFAPAAAALATGTPLSALGPSIDDMVVLPGQIAKRSADGALEGAVIHVDHYGNCVTSLRPQDFGTVDWRDCEFVVQGRRVDRTARFYDEGSETEPFVLLGSTGYLEVALRQGSAAERLGIRTGDPVRAEPRAATRVPADRALLL